MKITLKVYLPDATYSDKEEDRDFTEITFSEADSNQDDIELIVDDKRYWIAREELSKVVNLLSKKPI